MPTYHEAEQAHRFLQDLHAHVKPLFGRATIVVGDGSRDATASEVRSAKAMVLPVYLVRLAQLRQGDRVGCGP